MNSETKKVYNIIKYLHSNIYECIFNKSFGNINYIDNDKYNFLMTNLTNEKIDDYYPMETISRKFDINIAHFLPGYNGSCGQLHGHNEIVEIFIKKNVDQLTRMVLDFNKLKEIIKIHIEDKFDHRYLNELKDDFYPTSEMQILYFWELLEFGGLKGLTKIKMWETSNSCTELIDLDILNSRYYLNLYLKKYLTYLISGNKNINLDLNTKINPFLKYCEKNNILGDISIICNKYIKYLSSELLICLNNIGGKDFLTIILGHSKNIDLKNKFNFENEIKEFIPEFSKLNLMHVYKD